MAVLGTYESPQVLDLGDVENITGTFTVSVSVQ